MSVVTKRVLLGILGILGGFAAWPITEIILNNQESFNSYLIFTITQGGLLGLVLGAIFGMSEGLLTKNRAQVFKGLLIGLLSGVIGGALGALLGQKILLVIGSRYFSSYSLRESLALPISRSLGLGIMGLFIAVSEGVRAGSAKKIGIGIIGGLLGGLIGGGIMETLNIFSPDSIYTRLLGLSVMSMFIGIFYGVIEKGAATGVLRVLNGDLKRREYLLNQKKLLIGAKEDCDITIANYKELEEHHATITEIRGEVLISSNSPDCKLLVNDKPVEKQILKYEDVIKLGDVKMFYKHK